MNAPPPQLTPLALAALAVALLAGCVLSNEIRFETGDIGRAYVPGQIISALQTVGYSQMPFKSFKTDNKVKRTLRTGEMTEMRFLRRGTPTYIAIAQINTETGRVSVRLAEDGRESLSERGEAELELIRKALRNQFGPRVVS